MWVERKIHIALPIYYEGLRMMHNKATLYKEAIIIRKRERVKEKQRRF